MDDDGILTDKIFQGFESYTDIETFIYSVVPENGIYLDDSIREEVTGSFEFVVPPEEMTQITSNDVLSRSEFLGVLASWGNKDHEPVSEVDFNAMAKKMKKWGLDPSESWDKRMIEGLVKIDKRFSEQKTQIHANQSKLNKQFAQAITPEPIVKDAQTNENSSLPAKEGTIKEKAVKAAIKKMEKYEYDPSEKGILTLFTKEEEEKLKKEQKRGRIIEARQAKVDAFFNKAAGFVKDKFNEMFEKMDESIIERANQRTQEEAESRALLKTLYDDTMKKAEEEEIDPSDPRIKKFKELIANEGYIPEEVTTKTTENSDLSVSKTLDTPKL